MNIIIEKINYKVDLFEKSKRIQYKYRIKNFDEAVCTNSDYDSVILPPEFEQFIQEIKDLDVYEDDVWVLSYPKCGTTWTQEMVWQMCNDLKLHADGKDITERFPFIEFSGLYPNVPKPTTVEQVVKMSSPRFIKSHLPINFLPSQLWTKKPKIVYVMREPKDAAVSYYHHYRMFYKYSGTMDDFCESFLGKEVEYGDYWAHVKQFYSLRSESNAFFIKFEDLKHNMRFVLEGLSTFCGRPISTNEIDILEKHLDFKAMKNNPCVNREERMKQVSKEVGFDAQFMRRGETDSHKTEMSQTYVKKFDARTLVEFQGLDLY